MTTLDIVLAVLCALVALAIVRILWSRRRQGLAIAEYRRHLRGREIIDDE